MSTLFLICFVGIANVLSDIAIMIIIVPRARNPEKLVFEFNETYKLYIGFELFELYSQKNSDSINFLKTKISFALLWSAILRLRGCKKNLKKIQHRKGWSFPFTSRGKLQP